MLFRSTNYSPWTFLFARCCAKYGSFDCAKIDERPHLGPKL